MLVTTVKERLYFIPERQENKFLLKGTNERSWTQNPLFPLPILLWLSELRGWSEEPGLD